MMKKSCSVLFFLLEGNLITWHHGKKNSPKQVYVRIVHNRDKDGRKFGLHGMGKSPYLLNGAWWRMRFPVNLR